MAERAKRKKLQAKQTEGGMVGDDEESDKEERLPASYTRRLCNGEIYFIREVMMNWQILVGILSMYVI